MVTGLELLDDDPELPPEARETVAAVQRSAGTLSTMVNDYLDYAKIEAGQVQIHRRPVSVVPFLEQLCADVRHDAGKRGIDLRIEIDADPGVVDADPMALLRVLSNLLGNALKFTPPGGCITLRAARRDGSLVLDVSDTGPGVAAEEIPALFARYLQTASGRKKLGTGLGLFVVKSLTEAHGGSVAVDSEVGKGTTFRIVLPAAAAQEQAA
jgi:signal transduction histidine kinase